jgi:hypothetical protein
MAPRSNQKGPNRSAESQEPRWPLPRCRSAGALWSTVVYWSGASLEVRLPVRSCTRSPVHLLRGSSRSLRPAACSSRPFRCFGMCTGANPVAAVVTLDPCWASIELVQCAQPRGSVQAHVQPGPHRRMATSMLARSTLGHSEVQRGLAGQRPWYLTAMPALGSVSTPERGRPWSRRRPEQPGLRRPAAPLHLGQHRQRGRCPELALHVHSSPRRPSPAIFEADAAGRVLAVICGIQVCWAPVPWQRVWW